MNSNKYRLLWHSVKHTRIRQLWHRARLTAKRTFLVRTMTPERAKAASWHDPSSVALANNPALPVLPDRVHHVSSHDNASVVVKFLNIERECTLPFEWRPEELYRTKLLWLLNLHYHEFLEAVPGPLATRILVDWIEQVKPYVPGYWLDTWNSYTLSLRIVVWMQLLATSRLPMTDDEHKTIHGSLLAQLRFLENNLEVDLGGNHLLKNVKALLWGSRYFEGPEADRWRLLGERLLKQELAEQVLADGMHYELSPTYHNQVMADFLDCYQAMQDGPLKTHLAERLEDMAQLVADFKHPDGGVSLFNDSGLYFAYQPDELIDAWTRVFDRSIKPHRLIALPSSGYYGLRNDGELLLVDCAALAPDFLPAHGHGDALSFEWSIGGKRIFTDPGVYQYQDGPARAYSRATYAHNTVCIGGEDQSEFWKSFRVGRRARITACRHTTTDQGFTLSGAHDGYKRLDGEPVHEREFIAQSGSLVLRDTVSGGAGQPCTAALLLHPDCTVETEHDRRAVVHNGDTRVQVETEAPMHIEAASFHPDHGYHLDTLRIVISLGNANGQLTHTAKLTAM